MSVFKNRWKNRWLRRLGIGALAALSLGAVMLPSAPADARVFFSFGVPFVGAPAYYPYAYPSYYGYGYGYPYYGGGFVIGLGGHHHHHHHWH